jgi:lipopolysaccharide transport system ATP-binding protein
MNQKKLALKVEHISKCYRIGLKEEMHNSFASGVFNFIKSPVKNYHKYRSLYRFEDVEINGNSSDIIWALKDISFEIGESEIVGIIGVNGAGKSTLLKILSRITDPTGGRAEIRGRISSLLEVGTGFHPELTGRENVYLNGTILGMRKSELDRKFDEIVDFSGVEKFIDTPVKRYSSGMKVRLAFAVAAHLDPEILLIDEVLAVGDAEFQKKCISKMENVSEHGRTILFVSHNMQALTRLCPRAILLNGGVVEADGPSNEIVSSYLDYDKEKKTEKEWLDLSEAPGDDVVRLHAVRVRTQRGTVQHSVDIQETVYIDMEYEVLESGNELMIYYHVMNDQGMEVFHPIDNDPEWRRRPRPTGRFISTTTIPGNFLSEGMLYIGAGIWNRNPEFRRFSVKDAVAFLVTDSMEGDTARVDWVRRMPGVVRPLLNWETQYFPNGKK